mmetsp:Transcript_2484/g.3940  ORF Transcript_2484/g.3940 Transcript_2484/m.3940 type:complete len:148 (-) Transcript_2484:405-848(-)
MPVSVASLYRHVLRSIRLIPATSERELYLQEARSSFKKNMNLKDRKDIDTAIGTIISKLSFLHIKHPKTKEACPKDLPEGLELAAARSVVDGVSKTYYHNGRRISGGPENHTKARNYAGTLDPDDIKRHHQLVERQHFGGPFWKNKR